MRDGQKHEYRNPKSAAGGQAPKQIRRRRTSPNNRNTNPPKADKIQNKEDTDKHRLIHWRWTSSPSAPKLKTHLPAAGVFATLRGVRPGWREKVYKYMRIYLWSALRTMVLRMRVLRKRDLIADLHCLLTRQEDSGQVLVWPKGAKL